VDLDAGVFHCFGCGEEGGLKRFAELVGEEDGRPPTRQESEAARGWREVMQADERRLAALMEALPQLELNGWLRESERLVGAARQTASELGESDAVWDLLEHAATRETWARWADVMTE
jgi:hypothetical protein